ESESESGRECVSVFSGAGVGYAAGRLGRLFFGNSELAVGRPHTSLQSIHLTSPSLGPFLSLALHCFLICLLDAQRLEERRSDRCRNDARQDASPVRRGRL